jgi:hypothetical protein
MGVVNLGNSHANLVRKALVKNGHENDGQGREYQVIEQHVREFEYHACREPAVYLIPKRYYGECHTLQIKVESHVCDARIRPLAMNEQEAYENVTSKDPNHR